ncbi:1,3-beta-D-glucan synthase, partial [Quaeritorhiza haematococci]
MSPDGLSNRSWKGKLPATFGFSDGSGDVAKGATRSRSSSWDSVSGQPVPLFTVGSSSSPPAPGGGGRGADGIRNILPSIDLEEIFSELGHKFGFQRDNIRNQLENMTSMLESRASRMSGSRALISLHADYIGGQNANYKRWFLSEPLKHTVPVSGRKDPQSPAPTPTSEGTDDTVVSDSNNSSSSSSSNKNRRNSYQSSTHSIYPLGDLEGQDGNAAQRERAWMLKMKQMGQKERARQLALWLLIWGEAANIRLIPECLCFLFTLADDYYSGTKIHLQTPCSEGDFLTHVITPLYEFLRDRGYKVIGGQLVKKEKDHDLTIGYDDMNELFWSRHGIKRIVLRDRKTRLLDLPPDERYLKLQEVDWRAAFQKTFKERRTAMHLITNFSRIWILHLAFFYSYLAFAAGPIYAPELDDAIASSGSTTMFDPDTGELIGSSPDGTTTDTTKGAVNLRWTLTGLGGAIAVLFAMLATFFELSFFPISWKVFRVLLRRLGYLFLLFLFNIAPSIYVVLVSREGVVASILAAIQMLVGFSTIGLLVIVPPANLFVFRSTPSTWRIGNPTFTANFAPLKPTERALSIGVWSLVFCSKLIESLFFLVLPIARPLKTLLYLELTESCGRALMLCNVAVYSAAFLLVLLMLVLFFLDTYMWWIVWSTGLGVVRALFAGVSILTPWRNIFARLPERMYAKLFALNEMRVKLKPKALCAQLWNAVVVSMYEDHLLSLDHLEKLLYREHVCQEKFARKSRIEKPKFFVAQEDISTKMEFFPAGSEAERRITFFAQSLSMVFPEPTSVARMPAFSVLTPHYAEKILLPLREIIKPHSPSSSVTVLEYLKSLHGFEWENFVKDTKLWAQEEEAKLFAEKNDHHELVGQQESKVEDSEDEAVGDIPINAVGFKYHTPEAILRTRIWASLRSQTLYRTISGFMTYAKSLKLLYRIENPELVAEFGSDEVALDREIDRVVNSKFCFVVAMQRFASFSKEEREDVDLLLRIYPSLQIAYLIQEEESVVATATDLQQQQSGGTPKRKKYYSALIDGHCAIGVDGKRVPKYKIQLPGPVMLGDGEYLQMVDANQDNYFEEAIKVRSIFAELEPSSPSMYSQAAAPVAIVGGREYIFSEKIGVLGDVAAGKEYTFGTIAQRVTAKLGGRLHYGHPDFLNTIFMTTRGGVSKGQKGLHVNEDIYAGMMALQRGGRIKHTEYLQCGKGRDLGFSSILKFVAKIGAGMGEQMLSREQYYLGTQLPFDRLLTFFYAHPGFHVNNIFIVFSIQLFLLFMLWITAMYLTLTPCDPRPQYADISYIPSPMGCADFDLILEWIKQAVFAIVVVFAVTFLPLFLQIFAEHGFIAAFTRITKQVLSLSPLFDVFTTQIYAYTLMYDLNFGRAGYLGTGRGFATARNNFYKLFETFAEPSIYFGLRMFAILFCISMTYNFGQLAFFWIM